MTTITLAVYFSIEVCIWQPLQIALSLPASESGPLFAEKSVEILNELATSQVGIAWVQLLC